MGTSAGVEVGTSAGVEVGVSERVGVGFLSERIVHLHLTDLCNLTCAHCYSSSAPGRQTRLEPTSTLTGLRALHAEGYRVVSLSGGEPLLYRGLEALVASMRDIGYRVTIVTNGTVLASANARAAVRLCSSIAVSIDGLRARHDAVRAQTGSFDRAQRGLDWLAEEGIPFGVTCTVTASSLPEVPDVYDWVQGRGARLLNLRPLALVGRAVLEMADEVLSGADLGRLLVLASLLDGLSSIRVRTDVAMVDSIRASWADAFRVPAGATDGWLLADLVNPLIVTETGRLVPYAYGLAERLALGTIADVPRAADAARGRGGEPLHAFLSQARDLLPVESCVDWPAHLMAVSQITSSRQ